MRKHKKKEFLPLLSSAVCTVYVLRYQIAIKYEEKKKRKKEGGWVIWARNGVSW